MNFSNLLFLPRKSLADLVCVVQVVCHRKGDDKSCSVFVFSAFVLKNVFHYKHQMPGNMNKLIKSSY